MAAPALFSFRLKAADVLITFAQALARQCSIIKGKKKRNIQVQCGGRTSRLEAGRLTEYVIKKSAV